MAWLITWLWASALAVARNGINGIPEPGRIAVACLISGALLVPAFVVTSATLPLLDVKVCTVGGGSVKGSLIGQTDDRLYVGEYRSQQSSANRRIVALASSTVTEMFVGDGAGDVSCDEGLTKPE